MVASFKKIAISWGVHHISSCLNAIAAGFVIVIEREREREREREQGYRSKQICIYVYMYIYIYIYACIYIYIFMFIYPATMKMPPSTLNCALQASAMLGRIGGVLGHLLPLKRRPQPPCKHRSRRKRAQACSSLDVSWYHNGKTCPQGHLALDIPLLYHSNKRGICAIVCVRVRVVERSRDHLSAMWRFPKITGLLLRNLN